MTADLTDKDGKFPCPYYKRCGGCQLQHLSYEDQLHMKMAKEIKLLGKYGHIKEIISMEDPTHYRCKVQAAFGGHADHVISGIYQQYSHKIVPVDSCLIENQKADKIIVSLRKICGEHLRHALVRVGCFTGEIMVVLVVRSPILPGKNAIIKSIITEHPEVSTIVLNINDAQNSMVLGERNITLYGKGYIEDKLNGLIFRISPSSFYQINPVMTEKLYSTAINYLELTGKEKVIDAYCGTGTIGLIASKRAKEVIGTELNPYAISDAIFNAKHNKITNIKFIKADATDFMLTAAGKRDKIDALIMDPPRAGSTEKFIKAATKLSPQKIVYISCNSESLARDLGLFIANGYSIKYIQPFDMFPYTEHVETVVLLSRKNVKGYIEVELTTEELKQKKGSATFKEVKEYVSEHFGLSVSNLYIAQVKDKVGIKERENYNLGSEGHKVPQCPPEKEKAIMDALKYFGML